MASRFKRLFYTRHAEHDFDGADAETIWLHKLTLSQVQDEVVRLSGSRETWGLTPQVSQDGQWLVVSGSTSSGDLSVVQLMDLASNLSVTPLTDEPLGGTVFVAGRDGKLYFLTNHEAPNGRLVAINPQTPEPSRWRTVVAASDKPLEAVVATAFGFVACYNSHAAHHLRLLEPNGGTIGEVELPDLGSIFTLSGHPNDEEWFYGFESFAHPPTMFHACGVGSGQPIDPVEYPRTTDCEVVQSFATSNDGTQIPLFLVKPKKADPEPRPTILVGYGGFGVSMVPTYNADILAWIGEGGYFACACLRGGGEYGEDWHQAGSGKSKQNTFDDLASCAEWLIRHDWATSRTLIVQGSSNGGLAAAALLNQHPHLIAAAIIDNAVLDMLRFDQLGIGEMWVNEYGSPDDPDIHRVLCEYSPYHNVRSGHAYPPTLITVAAQDDRVHPSHSYKFAAALQQAQAGEAPILLRVRRDAGHGAGTAVTALIRNTAEVLAFAMSAAHRPTSSSETC